MRALEFALEAAPVEDIEQRIDVGTGLKLSDARARNGQLPLETLDSRRASGAAGGKSSRCVLRPLLRR